MILYDKSSKTHQQHIRGYTTVTRVMAFDKVELTTKKDMKYQVNIKIKIIDK